MQEIVNISLTLKMHKTNLFLSMKIMVIRKLEKIRDPINYILC